MTFPYAPAQRACGKDIAAFVYMNLSLQIAWLFILAIPIACVAWTITHEEIFAEPRNWCKRRCLQGKSLLERKFFYLFTCEYCFSFYVTALALLMTKYQLLLTGWRGYLIGEFSLVWIANIYMSVFFLIRTDLKNEGLDSKIKQSELEKAPFSNDAININTITK
jgi:hypothetical protein